MEKNKVISTVAIILIIIGIAMIYIGGFHGSQVILPPILTGVGFFFIAWALFSIIGK